MRIEMVCATKNAPDQTNRKHSKLSGQSAPFRSSKADTRSGWDRIVIVSHFASTSPVVSNRSETRPTGKEGVSC